MPAGRVGSGIAIGFGIGIEQPSYRLYGLHGFGLWVWYFTEIIVKSP